MSRFISQSFMDDLERGKLSKVLEIIRQDDTLMLELRGDRITIYYRGGKLLEIKEKEDSSYGFYPGDTKYLGKSSPVPDLSGVMINRGCDTTTLEDYIAKFKYNIDKYFGGIRNKTKVKKRFSIENEIRQHLVRENNYTKGAEKTDYFIIDTEYQTKEGKKFDIVALEWISKSQARKQQGGYKPRIVVFELKYGEDAIKGNCGICGHIKDFDDFASDKNRVRDFIKEMTDVLKQKIQLRLIPYLTAKNIIPKGIAKDIDFVTIIANYKNASKSLLNEIVKSPKFQMMTANFLGYGLYKQNLLDNKQVIDLLRSKEVEAVHTNNE